MKFALAGVAVALLVSGPVYAAVDVSGTTSGVFVNAQPGGATVTGVNTNNFTFGQGSPPSQLTFTGSSFSSAFETPFKIGSLYYYNGAVALGTEATAVDLKVTLDFSLPLGLPDATSTFTFSLVTTPNNGVSPADDADYVYFPSGYSPSSFVVGGTTYYVQLTGFQNATSSGFVNGPSSSEFHVLENASATADLYAKVTAVAPPGVPEPASWGLMIAGMAGIGAALRRGRPARRTIQFA